MCVHLLRFSEFYVLVVFVDYQNAKFVIEVFRVLLLLVENWIAKYIFEMYYV